MLRLALQDFPQLTLETSEVDRIGKSYTVDTLAALRAQRPHQPLVLVVGVDAFAGLPQWHRWQALFELAHIAVVTRPGTSIEAALVGPLAQAWEQRFSPDKVLLETTASGAIFAVTVTPQPISATAIRAALAFGPLGVTQVRGLLPEAVLTYIDQHQLYRTRSNAT